MFADADYCLLFAAEENELPLSDWKKQTNVCRFHFTFATNKGKLPFSVSFVFRIYSIYIETAAYIYRYRYIYMYIHCRFKRKTEAQAILLDQLNFHFTIF